jgi:hypothetical protein
VTQAGLLGARSTEVGFADRSERVQKLPAIKLLRLLLPASVLKGPAAPRFTLPNSFLFATGLPNFPGVTPSRKLRTLPALLILLGGAALSCKPAAPAFGNTLASARNNADEFFYSVSSRFTNIQRTPKLLRARQQFGHYALVPSGVYNDTSIWMSYGPGPDSARIFADDGYPTATQYIVVPHSSTEPPRNLAESREVVRLRRLSDSEFEWFTNVDVGVGHVAAQDLADVLAAALRAGERGQSAGIRADYRANFPRTTAALGRLYSLDTLRTTPDAEGATTFDLGIHLTPDSLAKVMPAYAKYIDKYVRKGRYHIVVKDRSGARWFDAWAGDYWIHIKLRSRDGHFVPIEGGIRAMPENLIIDASMQMKILIFTVGFEHMIGDFNLVNTPHERGYAIHFGTEPQWILPPTVHYFLKTPLARPFQGKGIPIDIGIRDTPGAQTMLNRRAMLVVQESAILRFINRLSGTAVGDFLGPSEREANRFNAEAFRALRSDVTSILQ